MPVPSEIRSNERSITEENHFASFRNDEIGVVVNKKDGSKTTVSVTGNNGSKAIFFGDKQMSTCRTNDDPVPITHTLAKRKGFRFLPKNTERKEFTKKTIKRDKGKGAHFMHRIHNGYGQ